MRDEMLDLQAIDIRTLSAEHWDAVMREAARRAHLERSRAFRDLIGRGWRVLRRSVRRVAPADPGLEATR